MSLYLQVCRKIHAEIMHRKIIIPLLLLALLQQQPTAQVLRPLTVGDSLPAIVIKNIINHHTDTFSTVAVKGKLLLLDFAATTCIPCIKAIPLLNELQQQFREKIQVIMVTAESREKVQRFMQNNKVAAKAIFPVAVEDSILHQLFPHGALPHEVWINPQGRLVAITDHQYLSAANMETVLKGILPPWPVKDHPGLLGSTPVIEQTKKEYCSLFKPYQQGLKTSAVRWIDSAAGSYMLRCTNSTIPDLYRFVLQLSPEKFLSKQFLVHPALMQRFFYDSSQGYKAEWRQKHAYNYEQLASLSFPLSLLQKKAMMELDAYLGISSSFYKKKQLCLVLGILPGCAPAASPKKEGYISLRSWMNQVNRDHSLPLLVDETAFTLQQLNRFYITESVMYSNEFSKWEAECKKAGLLLTRQERWVKRLEFRLAVGDQ